MSSRSTPNSPRDLLDRAKKLSDEASRELWTSVVEASEIFRKIHPQSKLKPFLAKVLEEIYREQKKLCPLCGGKLVFGQWHRDHIIPVCYGGGNERANIQLVHAECNLKKGKKTDLHELLSYLEDRVGNL